METSAHFGYLESINWKIDWINETHKEMRDRAINDLEAHYARYTPLLQPGEEISLAGKSGYNVQRFVETRTVLDQKTTARLKPNAYWSSHGFEEKPGITGWLDWVISEQPDWVLPWKKDVYAVKYISDESRILKLETRMELEEFTERYGIAYHGLMNIDWKRVKQDGYYGVNLTSYTSYLGLESDFFFWYHGWDCACHAVWDYRAIESVRKLELD